MEDLFIFNTKNLIKINAFHISDSKTLEIKKISPGNNPKDNSLMFFKKFLRENEEKLLMIKNSLIIIPEDIEIAHDNIMKDNLILYSENPRKDYALILQYILGQNTKERNYKQLENNIIIGENVTIGINTKIEPFVFIDHDVIIGDNCKIEAGVKIRSGAKICNNAIIRENSVIGGQGFGIERDSDGSTIRIPHIGGVLIGNNVEVGALNTIASGTIEPTIIKDYVKINDHVHIAHNCIIGFGTIITGCVNISGSAVIGENCWIGPNSTIRNGIKIGNNCTIGMGAVVTKSFSDSGITIIGNPAHTTDRISPISMK